MSTKSLGKIQKVDLREVWTDEARDFSPWLAKPENLALLSETLDMELELEGTNVPVGPYWADIVANDNSSNYKVIIENQLGKTNHDHLGKIITYASGLGAKVIIWIAKEFTEEHRQALDYLNENAAPNIFLYGIEIQVWKIGVSPPAPKFEIIAKPNEYTSLVKIGEGSKISQAKSIYLDFWTKFKEYCEAQNFPYKLRKPRPQHWYSIAIGRSKFQISLTASTYNRRSGCEIYLRGKNAKQSFKLLEQEKEVIEKETGSIDWQELPEGQDCRIIKYKQNVDITDKSKWEEEFKWLKDNALIFHKAFAQRIKVLPIIDDVENNEGIEVVEEKE